MALDQATCRVTCTGATPGGEDWANVFHVRSRTAAANASPDSLDMSTFAALFVALYNDMDSVRATTCTLTNVVVTPLAPATDAPGEFPQSEAGTDAGQPFPAPVSIVVSHRTALGGKSFRGRTFLSGFTEGASTGDQRLTTTARDTIGTAFENLANGLAVATATVYDASDLAVYSRKLDVATPITSFRIGTIFDYQRSRRGRFPEGYVTYTP